MLNGTNVGHTPAFSGAGPIQLRLKIVYAVGEIANSIKLVTFGLYSLFFATVVLGLPGTWTGIAAFIAMLWDAVVDPYIGYFTDGQHARSRRGRFMLIGGLTMGAGFWAFFSPPAHLSTPLLFCWLLATSLVVRSATSMFSIPYYSVGAALSQDYHERTSIAGIRGIASAIGTLLTASLSFVLFFPDKTAGVDPKLDRAGYQWMGFTFGLVMTSVALVSLFGTASLRRNPAQQPEPAQPVPADFFRSMWTSLRIQSFRRLWIASCLVIVALAVNSSLLLHFLKYYAKVNGSVALSTSQGCFFGAGLAGTLVWLRIARRFDKHRLYVLSAVVTAALMSSAAGLFGAGHLFGTGNVVALLIGYGLTGFFQCILWFIPQSMLADVADEAYLLTGRRCEGALFGMFSFGQQVATGLAIMLAGWLLDRVVHLVPGASGQTASAVQRIALVYSFVPAALFLTAAALMLSYRLTRSRVAAIQLELQQRSAAGEAGIHASVAR